MFILPKKGILDFSYLIGNRNNVYRKLLEYKTLAHTWFYLTEITVKRAKAHLAPNEMPRRRKEEVERDLASGKTHKPQQRNAANARERSRMRILSKAFSRLKVSK